MKHIYLNLKRFDVPVELGGVNRLAPVKEWGAAVVRWSSCSICRRPISSARHPP